MEAQFNLSGIQYSLLPLKNVSKDESNILKAIPQGTPKVLKIAAIWENKLLVLPWETLMYFPQVALLCRNYTFSDSNKTQLHATPYDT